MSGVLEAYEDVLNDRFSVLKILFVSGLVYACYYFYSLGQIENFQICSGVVAFILLNYMLCIINNVRSNLDYVLPKVFSFQFILFSLKSVLVLPMLALMGWCIIKLLSLELFSDIEYLRTAYKVFSYCLPISIGVFSLMLFGETANPFSAYNLVLIFKHTADAFLKIVYSLVVMFILNALVLGTIAYVFWVFLSLEHIAFIVICTITFVLDLSALAHCLAQIEYEVVPKKEDDNSSY